MRQRSQVRHSRHHWTHQATQRGDRDRYQRTPLARITAERDRATQALTEAQARLRPLGAHLQGLVARPQGDLVLVTLPLCGVARSGCRAVSRVLSLLAWALGLTKAPWPPPVITGVRRRALVRIDAARLRQGVPWSPAPLRHGLLWRIDRRRGLGTGTMGAVLAVDAHHPPRAPGALSLDRGHGIAVAVADAWTGDTSAQVLGRLLAVMGRPTASRTDGGGDLHQALAWLEEHGLASPGIDAIAHAAAGMLKRSSHDPPTFATVVSACGRVSGTLTHTMLACVAPPTGRTNARVLPGHRLGPWADRVLKRSPAGGATSGSTCATVRARLDDVPSWNARITRLRTDAFGRRACQKMVTTQGRSHAPRTQCEPLMAAMPSAAWRQACHAARAFPLETAKTRGLEHVGVPISSEAIASLCGVAKRPGGGETQDAARSARRLPA